MKTTEYDALLEKRYATPAEIAQRKDAAKLAEIARNAESLSKLAEAEAARGEPEAGPTDVEPTSEAITPRLRPVEESE